MWRKWYFLAFSLFILFLGKTLLASHDSERDVIATGYIHQSKTCIDHNVLTMLWDQEKNPSRIATLLFFYRIHRGLKRVLYESILQAIIVGCGLRSKLFYGRFHKKGSYFNLAKLKKSFSYKKKEDSLTKEKKLANISQRLNVSLVSEECSVALDL